jgi:hypothetical protein
MPQSPGTTHSVPLPALVVIPDGHPLADVGVAARGCVQRAMREQSTLAGAAAALGISSRAFIRVRAAMAYIPHDIDVVSGYPLGTIDDFGKSSKLARGKHDIYVSVGKTTKPRKHGKSSKTR